MIHLIKFGRKATRFPITESIIEQIPGWGELIKKHDMYSVDVIDDWKYPYNKKSVSEEAAHYSAMLDELISLIKHKDKKDVCIVIGRTSPSMLDARTKKLEGLFPVEYTTLSRQLRIYCPCSAPGRNNKNEFHTWYIV